MEVFSTQTQKPTAQVFKLPAERPVFKLPKATENRDRALYPFVTNLPKEEVDAHMDAGILGPLVDKAEVGNKAKQQEIVTTVLEDQPEDMTAAIDELEAARNENPFLKQFVSPATLAALKQSDSPLARKVAQTKLANAAIAIEVIEKFTSEAEQTAIVDYASRAIPGLGGVTDKPLNIGDYLDSWVSDLPILSSINVERRKDLANRFVATLDSNADPAVIRSELEAIVAEAADQGLFTQNNKFYLADFLALVSEGTTGSEAAFQETLGAMDTTIGIASWLGDAARVLARTRRGKDAVLSTIQDAAKTDDPVAGHSTVVDLTTSVTKTTTATPISRTPDEATAFLEFSLESQAFQDAAAIRIASGKAIDDEAFEAFRLETIALKKASAEREGVKRLIDVDVTIDLMENVKEVELFGTVKGRAYTNEKVATKEAEKLGGIAVKAKDGSGWLVQVERNVPTQLIEGHDVSSYMDGLKFYRESSVNELSEGFFAEHIWSPLTQTSFEANAINKQGEAARSKAQAIFSKPLDKALKGMSKESVKAVENVLTDINQGVLASTREWPSIPKFDEAFYRINKRIPTDKERDLYLLKKQRSDVNWYLSADIAFKREVNQGLEVFKFNELEVKGTRVKTELIPDQLVWSEDAGKFLKASDLPKDSKVIRLVEPQLYGGKYTNYVASTTPKARALKYSDVLGYNPGGPRIYEPNKQNWIIKQTQQIDLADGSKMDTRPTAIMAVKTVEEAKAAEESINALLKAVHDVLSPHGVKFDSTGKATDIPKVAGAFAFDKDTYLRAVKSLASDGTEAAALGYKLNKTDIKKLDDLIAEKSDWNRNVHSLKTMVEFFEDMNLDLRKAVDYTEDNQPIIKGDSFVGDLTWKDALGIPGTLKSGNVRRDKVMIGYGGAPIPTVPAMEAIQSSVVSSVMRSTNHAYETYSSNSLLKNIIKGTGSFAAPKPVVTERTLEEIRGLIGRARLKALEGKIFTNSAEGRKLELERQKILYRLEQQNFLDAGIAKIKDRLANDLYGAGWKKTANFMDKYSPEPVSAVRGIVFDNYLGMLNPAQVWVQGSALFGVMALSKGANGVRAAVAMPYVRGLLLNGNKAPVKLMGRLMAKELGITPEQFVTIVEELKLSGRADITSAVTDIGESNKGILFQRVREKGRVFYNEGELISRITAHISASMEWLQKAGKDADLTSTAARRFIMGKQDELTFGMTSQSRTAIEQLPMMQFQSYSMRMLEYLFSGLVGDIKSVVKGEGFEVRNGAITLKQKGKLFGTQLALFGLSATAVAGYAMDYYNWQYGLDIDPDTYRIMREGVLDGIVFYLTGVETQIGRRLAWGEGFYNTISDMSGNTFLETISGPMGSLAMDVLGRVTNLVKNVETSPTWGDAWNFLGPDVRSLLRTVSSVNQTYNAFMAWQYGQYFTKKSDQPTVADLDGFEIAAIALGIPLKEVNAVWKDIEFLSKNKGYAQDTARRIEERWNSYYWYLDNEPENTEMLESIERQILFIYNVELADPIFRKEVDRLINPSIKTTGEEVLERILKTGTARREEVLQ